jgi:hypothetical protein
MQITTLNKIINLILSGSLIISITYILILFYFPDYLATLPISNAGFVAASLPVAIFLGVIIESMSENLRILFRAGFLKFILYLFGAKKRWERMLSVGSLFRGKLLYKADLKGISLKEVGINEDVYIANVAQCLVFQKCNSETSGWILQHLSLSLLASNYALITLSLAVGSLFLNVPLNTRLILFISGMSATYVLCHIWIRKFIFSHTELYWEAYVLLSDEALKLDLRATKQSATGVV